MEKTFQTQETEKSSNFPKEINFSELDPSLGFYFF